MSQATKTRTRARPKEGAPFSSSQPARAGGVAVRPPTAAARAGGIPAGGASGGSLLGLGADVSGQMEALAPTFGDILSSVGLGVANSQAALDHGVIDTVNTLANTKITVVTEVVEQLDDDGLPDVDLTQLVSQELSVLNFVTPTVHEWKHVALSMDMTVGAMDDETGASYSVKQSSSSIGTAGLFFGIIGVGYMSESDSYRSMQQNSHREAQWATGNVQLDAILAPRRTTKFPVPASVQIGPQMYVSQGSVAEQKTGNVVTSRTIDALVNVRKADGSANPGKSLELDSAGLLPSFSSGGGFNGSTTNADGQCKVTLKRTLTPGFTAPVKRTCTVRLGQMTKRFEVMI
jgi:hypothetical protein